MRTRYDVQRSKVKVTWPINGEIRSVSPTNFKFGRRLEHVHALTTVPWTAINACEVQLLHANECIPCRLQEAATQLVIMYFLFCYSICAATVVPIWRIKLDNDDDDDRRL